MSQSSAVPARLDHLMVVVPDLEAGVREFAELTGTTPVKGGRHATGGTANYLIGLHPLPGVDDIPPYLEILGPDPEANPAFVDRQRDIIADADRPVLRTWLVRALDIDADAARAEQAGYSVGEVSDLSRVTPEGTLLEWRLTRKHPRGFGGAQPSLIDWGQTPHPAASLEPQLTVEAIEVHASDGARSEAMLAALGLEVPVRETGTDTLVATLLTPKGTITITSAGVQ